MKTNKQTTHLIEVGTMDYRCRCYVWETNLRQAQMDLYWRPTTELLWWLPVLHCWLAITTALSAVQQYWF